MTPKSTAEFLAEARAKIGEYDGRNVGVQFAIYARTALTEALDRLESESRECNNLIEGLYDMSVRLEAAESQLALLRMRDPDAIGFQEQLFASVKSLGELRDEHEALKDLYVARKEIDERELSSLRSENAELRHRLEKAEEAEQVRWQKRIHSIECVRDEDASGNESGDPLDYTEDCVKHAIGKLQDELSSLRGVIASDDERLKTAAIRVWGEHRWGCDTADHLADAVLSLRAEIAELRRVVAAVEIQLGIRKSLMASGLSTAAESCTNVVDLLCKILKSGREPKT